MTTKHTNLFKQVEAFNLACDNEPTGPFGDLARLYRALFQEEAHTELGEALEKLDAITGVGEDPLAEVEAIADVADALLDTIYIAAGWMHVMGLDANELWSEVQRSNMAKIGADGKVLKREDGKIIKPDGWQPPRIRELVAKQLGYVKRVGKDLDAQLAAKAKTVASVKAEIAQASTVERMFSIEQAAVLCGISKTLISEDVKSGKLRHKVFGVGTIRIPESALAEYQSA